MWEEMERKWLLRCGIVALVCVLGGLLAGTGACWVSAAGGTGAGQASPLARVDLATRTVRVGVFPLHGFFEEGGERGVQGYGVDYLEKIAEKTGWRYEYVWSESWEENLEALREGRVDLVAPAGGTDARRQEFDFSNFNIGVEFGVLLTTADREELAYEDFAAFDGLQVGCVGELVFRQAFGEYADRNGFQVDTVFYADTQALMEALRRGDVDAVIANFFAKADDSKVLARFGAAPYYFMLGKGSDSLQLELNEAMQELKIESTELDTEILEKYYPDYYEIPFTKSEMDYVEELGTLRVGCRIDIDPVSYLDEETGEVQGITRDILDEISKASGLTFEYVPLPVLDVTYDVLCEMDLDLVSSVEYNYRNMRSVGLHVTQPYLAAKKVFVCRKDTLFDADKALRLAVSTGSQTLPDIIHDAYPNFELVNLESTAACFEAVRKGEADVLLQNQYAVTSYLSKPVNAELVTVPVEGIEDRLSLSPVLLQEKGVLDPVLGDERLFSVLNKSVRQISSRETTRLILRTTMEGVYRYGLSDFLYLYRYAITLIGAAVLAVIAVLLYVGRLRQRNLRRLSLEQRRYHTLVENSGTIVFEFGHSGERVVESPGFEERFGWRMADPGGKQLAEEVASGLRIAEGDRDAIERAVTRVFMQKKNVEETARICAADGREAWCRITLYPMPDARGTVVSLLGKIVDINEEVLVREELENRSRIDPMTGLYNKNAFYAAASESLSRDPDAEAAFIFLDVDNFKQVNDQLGHIMGDNAIRETARRLAEIFEGYGLIGRFGGDEFCLLLRGLALEELRAKLKQAVMGLRVSYPCKDGEVRCTVSIGAACTDGGQAGLDELMDRADRALYYCKENGKDGYAIFREIEEAMREQEREERVQ